ncbi:MAG TPA: LCP family protein [Egibacteraceae bacterium]|nr:LCP family protein [Egibacteraceae bacterium]
MLRRRQHAASPPHRRRALIRLTAVFCVSVLVGATAALGAVHWGFAKVDRSAVTGLVGGSAQAAEVRETGPRLLNVLLVGNDSREGLTRAERREFGTGQAEGNRTDTLMLLQLELDGDGRGAVLSFPRDLLVTRCDGSRGRINAAYGIGIERNGDGPSCVVKTVADLTGVSIHHYVEVSFAGFLKVVDTLGGVGLYLDEPLYDEKAHLDLPAGCVRLRGPDALGFVRARHLDNDFGRIARQQRFIKETLREATDVGVLANPAKLLRIVDAAASSVHTDDKLGLEQMHQIALGMRRLTAQGLEVHTVPSDATLSGSSWYVEQHPEQARRLYAAFRDGSVLTDNPEPTEPATPSRPPVTVLNGGDADGAAAAAAALLEAEGWTVQEVGNAEIGGLERTRILHPPEMADAAEALAAVFPDADVIAGVSGLPLTVKLGSDTDVGQVTERAEALTDSDEGVRPGGVTSSEVAEELPASEPEPAYRGAQMTDVDC